MTTKEGPPQQLNREAQSELSPSEKFIYKLYGAINKWLIKEKNGSVVEKLDHQRIDHWDSHEFAPGRSVSLGIDIAKAVLISTPKEDFALVLGKRRSSRYEHAERLSLQFGFWPKPNSKFFEKLPLTDKLRQLVNQQASYGSAEFYVHDMTDEVTTDAWADSRTFGGQEFRSWKKGQKTTDRGLEACLEIVQRTTRNAFL